AEGVVDHRVVEDPLVIGVHGGIGEYRGASLLAADEDVEAAGEGSETAAGDEAPLRQAKQLARTLSQHVVDYGTP
ncbi:MAG: hypothetical protein ACTMII_06425, partial [Brachybacterium sp.]